MKYVGVVETVVSVSEEYHDISRAYATVVARSTPGSSDSAREFVDFCVENVSRVPLSATLDVGQWVIVLVLLTSVARAASAMGTIVTSSASCSRVRATDVYKRQHHATAQR